MRQVRVVLTCDEGFVADSLRDFANAYEDAPCGKDWLEVKHGSGFLEFVEVPDPAPNLADVFDVARNAVLDERDRKRRELMDMQAADRKWIDETITKLEFLKDRGFKVTKYFGGIVDGHPYNYIRIDKGGNCWVEIEGSSARRKDGTLDLCSPFIANYEHPRLETLIKEIAQW